MDHIKINLSLRVYEILMVFLSQDVRRWKGVSKEGGGEWESYFNELSRGEEQNRMQRLEEEEAMEKIH